MTDFLSAPGICARLSALVLYSVEYVGFVGGHLWTEQGKIGLFVDLLSLC